MVRNNQIEYEYTDRTVQIEKNLQKMMFLISKKGGSTITELKALYICEFYSLYRMVEEDLKG